MKGGKLINVLHRMVLAKGFCRLLWSTKEVVTRQTCNCWILLGFLKFSTRFVELSSFEDATMLGIAPVEAVIRESPTQFGKRNCSAATVESFLLRVLKGSDGIAVF